LATARIGNGTGGKDQFLEVLEFFDLLENCIGRVTAPEGELHNGLPRLGRLTSVDFAARLDDGGDGLPFYFGLRKSRLCRARWLTVDILSWFRGRLRRCVTVAAGNRNCDEHAGERMDSRHGFSLMSRPYRRRPGANRPARRAWPTQ